MAKKRYQSIIIGAGIAGLLAAEQLQRHGRKVIVVEKSHGVGGRMASRRIGDALFDHGAQFITARDAAFRRFLKQMEKLDLISPWFGAAKADEHTHPRWRGKPAMTAIAKHLSRNLEIKLEAKAEKIWVQDNIWQVKLDDLTTLQAETLLLTPPVPQSLELIDYSDLNISDESRMILAKLSYDRCLAVLVRIASPSNIPQPGFLRKPSDSIYWLSDNQLKGISPSPALTIHATTDFSLRNWSEDRRAIGEKLIEEARRYMQMKVLDFQVHGWKFARPQHVRESRSHLLYWDPLLLIAGDAFGGPRVEGAALSGWDAARKLENYLGRQSQAEW